MNEDAILEILKEQYERTGGHCGTYLVNIKNNLNIELQDLKEALNKLYKSKKITVHDGIHGRLIKYKN